MAKKILKVIITIIIVLIAAYLIILLTNHFNRKKEPEITVEYQGDMGKRAKISAWDIDESLLVYYKTMEEAVKKAPLEIYDKDSYMRRIDSTVKVLENDSYAMLFYTSTFDKNKAALVAVKFKVKIENGERLYALMAVQPLESEKGSKRLGTVKEAVETGLTLSDFESVNGIDPEKRFIWSSSDSKKIYKLKIEGQKPTEIIPYEIVGETEYLWYFDDVKSRKAGSRLEVSLDK